MNENKKLKTIVVLPAYNAEKTLKQTVNDVPHDIVDEIILVDDGSHDDTVKLATEMGLFVHKHAQNRGYGGNQKTCYTLALERGADIVVMLHPDYQYDPKLIKYFIEFIADGYFDVMLGTRIRSRREALAGGMPFYKYVANRLLSSFENVVSGYNLGEWHTGMRAYKSDVLKNIDFMRNSEDFVFDTQVLFQIVEKRYRIGEIPVPVKYFKEASMINFSRSMRYGIETVWTSVKFLFRRILRRFFYGFRK